MEMKGQMDVQEAVQAAKEYINKIFKNENIQWVGLEEIVFDDALEAWKVTIGFSRAWGLVPTVSAAIGDRSARVFKVVQIDDRTGRIVSLTDRALLNANLR